MFSIASMSASVGFLFALSSATAFMIWPGWQKPHCGTSSSSHACWTGCSTSPLARPSIVVTRLPATDDTGVTHVCTALLLTRHVQALQTLTPQPYFGPVMPSLSRRTHSSARSAGASTLTGWSFTRKLYVGIVAPLDGGRNRQLAGRRRCEGGARVERELARLDACRARVGVGDGTGGRRHRHFAHAGDRVTHVRHEDDLDRLREIGHPREGVLVVAALEHAAVADRQAGLEHERDRLGDSAVALLLDARRIHRLSDVDRHGDACDPAVLRVAGIELDDRGGERARLHVHANTLREARRHRLAPLRRAGDALQDPFRARQPKEFEPEVDWIAMERRRDFVDDD